MIHFTSDTHFGHKNILRYDNRPFKSIEEHDSALIRNWRETVTEYDEIYHLGDFSFCSKEKTADLLSKLPGKKYLVIGNHDRDIMKTPELRSQFKKTNDIMQFNYQWKGESIRIVLCHYSMRVWYNSHHGSVHLFGHSHGSLQPDKGSLSLDVGCMNWNYYPVSIDTVLFKLKGDKWSD